MKNLLLLPLLGLLVIAAAGLSCKGSDLKNLEYSDISTFDWLQANVKNKKGDGVLWFQIFDQVEDKVTIDGYKSSKEKVGSYPAKIYENKWVWMMINNRIEIRLIADDKNKEFQNTDKLKKFIESFDLSGMEKVAGPKVKGKDLQKFIPKLGSK